MIIKDHHFLLPAVAQGRALWLLTALFICMLMPGVTSAQLLHLDDMPFFSVADSTSRLAAMVEIDRFSDPKYDWTTNRLMLTAIFPAGAKGEFFARMPYLLFDTGEISVRERWPWLAGENSEPGWPGEARVSGFGHLEIGAITPIKAPLLKQLNLGVSLSLPTGRDRLYPQASSSMPLRFVLRKDLPVKKRTNLGITTGYLMNVPSSKDLFEESAFPDGYQAGLSLNHFMGRNSRWALAWDYQNRQGNKSQIISGQWWVPWTDVGSVGFKVGLEMHGTLYRAVETYFSITWRFDSPSQRPGANLVETPGAPIVPEGSDVSGESDKVPAPVDPIVPEDVAPSPVESEKLSKSADTTVDTK